MLRAAPLHPQQVDPHLPSPLALIISKAMARNPRDRYATARQFARDLEAFANDRPLKLDAAESWSTTKDRRYTLVLAACAVITLLLLGSFAATLFLGNQQQNAESATIERLREEIAEARQQKRDPLAPTPDLDARLGRSVTLDEESYRTSRRIATDKRAWATSELRDQPDVILTAELKSKARAYLEEADKQREAGDIGLALQNIESALEIAPRLPEALIAKGHLLVENEQIDEATWIYSMVLEQDSASEDLKERALLARGRAYIDLEDPVSDHLAEHDLSRVTGSLCWRAGMELARLNVDRQRLPRAYLLHRKLLERMRKQGALIAGEVTKNEAATLHLRYAQIAMKLGREVAEVEDSLRSARELSEDEELDLEIERVTEALDEALR